MASASGGSRHRDSVVESLPCHAKGFRLYAGNNCQRFDLSNAVILVRQEYNSGNSGAESEHKNKALGNINLERLEIQESSPGKMDRIWQLTS